MLLDLNRLHGHREHVERSLQPSLLGPTDPDYGIVAPVELSMDVSRVGTDAFEVSGRVTTRLELVCGRCLESYEMPLDAAFELRYVPQVDDVVEGEEREVEADDLTVAYYRDGLLDIAELLREQFQLALPMKPLCGDGCRGLCVQCGANLNRDECGCAPAWEDPRLAPLRDLLTRPKEN